MDDKEHMRRKFEASMHRGSTYTERDFQMWCAGHAQGVVEEAALRILSPTHDIGRLTNVKALDISRRDGYEFTGYVLTDDDGKKCIVDMSAVRWIKPDEFWKLMHPSHVSEKSHD